MNCWHCNEELIWGGDHDIDESEEMECESYVEVYHKIKN